MLCGSRGVISVLADRAASATAGIDGVEFERENGSSRGKRTGLQARPLSLDMDLRELTFFMLTRRGICVQKGECLRSGTEGFDGSTNSMITMDMLLGEFQGRLTHTSCASQRKPSHRTCTIHNCRAQNALAPVNSTTARTAGGPQGEENKS